MNTDLRAKILSVMTLIAHDQQLTLPDPFPDDVLLLESGLDSLSFAILVARLEEELGYDPFVMMTQAVYPKTLKEFTEIYEKYAPGKK